jgi:hypothetical protein
MATLFDPDDPQYEESIREAAEFEKNKAKRAKKKKSAAHSTAGAKTTKPASVPKRKDASSNGHAPEANKTPLPSSSKPEAVKKAPRLSSTAPKRAVTSAKKPASLESSAPPATAPKRPEPALPEPVPLSQPSRPHKDCCPNGSGKPCEIIQTSSDLVCLNCGRCVDSVYVNQGRFSDEQDEYNARAMNWANAKNADDVAEFVARNIERMHRGALGRIEAQMIRMCTPPPDTKAVERASYLMAEKKRAAYMSRFARLFGDVVFGDFIKKYPAVANDVRHAVQGVGRMILEYLREQVDCLFEIKISRSDRVCHMNWDDITLSPLFSACLAVVYLTTKKLFPRSLRHSICYPLNERRFFVEARKMSPYLQMTCALEHERHGDFWKLIEKAGDDLHGYKLFNYGVREFFLKACEKFDGSYSDV